jgi:hypothetical protein
MPSQRTDDDDSDYDDESPRLPTVVLDSAGTGLLSCMDHLTGSGVYLDPFESLRVQHSIMQLLMRLMAVASSPCVWCSGGAAHVLIAGLWGG